MKFVPKPVSRFASRSLLKANANSPTLLVVAGVVGFGATAVMAARATRKIDPVIESHTKTRWMIKQSDMTTSRDEQKALLSLYTDTTIQLGRIYGPTLVVGTLSAASILSGHRIMKGRYVATMAAYSGLFDQFQSYRKSVSSLLGDERERELYDGATLEWREDPDHKGEYKLESKYAEYAEPGNYLRPFFDEGNVNWTHDPTKNYLFLKGVQSHMQDLLKIRGHVFLNEVYDALHMSPRPREGAVTGWLLNGEGDNYIDFGFMASNDPSVVAFRNGKEKSVRLNFNIDGIIWDKI